MSATEDKKAFWYWRENNLFANTVTPEPTGSFNTWALLYADTSTFLFRELLLCIASEILNLADLLQLIAFEVNVELGLVNFVCSCIDDH